MENQILSKNDSKDSALESVEFWMNQKIDKNNLLHFFNFIIVSYPEYLEDLTVIRKKIIRKNLSILSNLIVFLRVVDKVDGTDDLCLMIRKLIQVFIDNPKGFKR